MTNSPESLHWLEEINGIWPQVLVVALEDYHANDASFPIFFCYGLLSLVIWIIFGV